MRKSYPKTDPNVTNEFAPGTLVGQMVRCGKPNCKCSRGELHGPYFWRCYRLGGRIVKYYVRKADLTATRAACAEWHRLQARLRINRALHADTMRRMRAYLRATGA